MDMPPRVFVVDDEPAICRLVSMALGAEGYAVDAFDSAEAFREAISGCGDEHVLIVDKNLPGMNGLELVTAHKQQDVSRFEAIMITGFADEESEREAKRIGICRYIRKPFVLGDLRDAVEHAVSRLGDND